MAEIYLTGMQARLMRSLGLPEELAAADPMGLAQRLPGGALLHASSREADLIGSCIPKRAEAGLASRVVAYVLGKSFATDVRLDECDAMAEEMLARFSDDRISSDYFDWSGIKAMIDERIDGRDRPGGPWLAR